MHPPQQLKIRSLKIGNIEKNITQPDLLYTAGGSINWYILVVSLQTYYLQPVAQQFHLWYRAKEMSTYLYVSSKTCTIM